MGDLTWTVKVDHEWLVRAAPMRHRAPCFGFLLREANRRAAFLAPLVSLARSPALPPACLPAYLPACLLLRPLTCPPSPTHPPQIPGRSLASPPHPLHTLLPLTPLPRPHTHARRSGKLDMAKAEALGVTEGAHCAILKNGGAVEVAPGQWVRAEQCVGGERRGR